MIKIFIKKVIPLKIQDEIKKIIYYTTRFSWIDYFKLQKKLPIINNHKVSIIIPSYKNTHFLREAVMSAINQTYKNIEILVMTDVPEYGASKILEDLSKKINLYIEVQKHSKDKFNELVKRSTGDLIILLCDDDILDKKYVEKTVYMLDKKNTDIVYTDTRNFGGNNDYGYWKKWSTKNFLETTPTPVTALFKKKVWKEVGGYSGDTYFDWDFWWSAYKKGFKSYHLRQPLFFYRIHPNQDTNICDHKKLKEIILKKHNTI